MSTQLIDFALFLLAGLTASLIVWHSIQIVGRRPNSVFGVFRSILQKDGEQALSVQVARQEQSLAVLGTIASAAPFLGLAGTIFHVITALSKLGTGADLSVIGGPIANSLYATLYGLASAIPASIAYNILSSRLEFLEKATLLSNSGDSGEKA